MVKKNCEKKIIEKLSLFDDEVGIEMWCPMTPISTSQSVTPMYDSMNNGKN